MSEDDPGGAVGDYSGGADEQLDEIEAADPDLYNDILTMCELVFERPDTARSMSSAIRTDQGVRFRLLAPARDPHKIFWSPDGPRIEAVFPPARERWPAPPSERCSPVVTSSAGLRGRPNSIRGSNRR